MLIDTHCHLDFPQFDGDRKAVIERAHQAGVGALINVASNQENSVRIAELVQSYPRGFYGTVGVHPHEAKHFNQAFLKKAAQLAVAKKTVAVGEVGLDYFRNLSPQDVQRDVFKIFIRLAAEHHLPLIVHSRGAHQDVLNILKEQKADLGAGVVIHCFSGDQDFLKACLDEGFFISFTANITYQRAEALRDVATACPLERMMLETDAPFLSYEAKRGKRNEPAYLVELAQLVARLKKVSFEQVCAQTTRNANHFFNLDIGHD